MGDVEKLTCLYLLTWADMCSVAPGMWTGWKAQLLRDLYTKARAVLLGTGAQEAGAHAERVRERFHTRWARAFGEERARTLEASLPERYFLGMEAERATLHGRLLARARRMPLAAALRHRPDVGFTELHLAAEDRPGLLALFAGVLSAYRIDILSARIASTSDGLALDVFDVRPPHGQLLDRQRWRSARADLLRVLRGEATTEDVFRRRRPGALSAEGPAAGAAQGDGGQPGLTGRHGGGRARAGPGGPAVRDCLHADAGGGADRPRQGGHRGPPRAGLLLRDARGPED